MWNNIFVIWKFLYLFILWFRFYLIDLTVYILLCHEIASLNFISNEENPIPIDVPFLVFILISYLLQPTTYLTEKKRKKKKKKKIPNPPSKWTVSWTCPTKGDGLFKVLSFWIIEH